MLAKTATSWEKRDLFLASPYRCQAIQRSADKVVFFRRCDLHGHALADFWAAHDQHPATGQLLPCNIVQIGLFFRIF